MTKSELAWEIRDLRETVEMMDRSLYGLRDAVSALIEDPGNPFAAAKAAEAEIINQFPY